MLLARIEFLVPDEETSRERRGSEERWIRSYKVVFIERTRSSGQIGSVIHPVAERSDAEYLLAVTGNHRGKIHVNNETREESVTAISNESRVRLY